MEKSGLSLSRLAPNARPLDLSLDPDPGPLHPHSSPCPFPTVGGDITITLPTEPALFFNSEDFIETVTANTKANLQTKERSKFMHAAEKASESSPNILGERIMGELMRANVVLLPLVVTRWASGGR